MTLEDIKKLDTLQTRTIAEDIAKDDKTLAYIVDCLQNKFYKGDYGEVGAEDTEYNNLDLAEGEGHILARYKQFGSLQGDFYIEAHFSESVPGVDANNVFIMYPFER